MTQAQVQNTLLAGSLKIATLVNANLTALTGGVTFVSWDAIKVATRGLNAIQRQYNLGDYTSPNMIIAYNCLSSFVGTFGGGGVNPNAQNPGTIINVTGSSNLNTTRVQFSGQTTISLTGYQSTYKPLYGSNPTVLIFPNGSPDYTTAPIYTYVRPGDETSGIDTITWTYPVPITGYVLISGAPSS